MTISTSFTASTASFTSCTLRIEAPFSRAIVFKTVVPFRASSGFMFSTLLIMDFLERPARTGYPDANKTIQLIQQLKIVLYGFSKAKSRIKDDFARALNFPVWLPAQIKSR